MAQVSRCDAADADRVGEGHNGSIHQAKAEVSVQSVDFHGSEGLLACRWGVGERAPREMVHEHVHGPPFSTQEVVKFSQNQSGNVARAGSVNGATKRSVVGRALDEIVKQRARVAYQRGRAITGH